MPFVIQSRYFKLIKPQLAPTANLLQKEREKNDLITLNKDATGKI